MGLCPSHRIPPNGTWFQFVPSLVVVTLATEVGFPWLLYWTMTLFHLSLRCISWTILWNYVNILSPVYFFIYFYLYGLIVFYLVVYNQLTVLLPSKFKSYPIWPLGSPSGWLPWHFTCLQHPWGTPLLSDTRCFRPLLALSFPHIWNQSFLQGALVPEWKMEFRSGGRCVDYYWRGAILRLFQGQNEGICVCVHTHSHSFPSIFTSIDWLL